MNRWTRGDIGGVACHPIPACNAVTVTVPPVELLVTRHPAIGQVEIEPMPPIELAAGPPTCEA